MPTQWMNMEQAAEYCGGKDRRIISAAIDKGELPAYNYGKKDVRVSADDVDTWLRSRPFEGK
jgi:excisionase family DNA binding protein